MNTDEQSKVNVLRADVARLEQLLTETEENLQAAGLAAAKAERQLAEAQTNLRNTKRDLEETDAARESWKAHYEEAQDGALTLAAEHMARDEVIGHFVKVFLKLYDGHWFDGAAIAGSRGSKEFEETLDGARRALGEEGNNG